MGPWTAFMQTCELVQQMQKLTIAYKAIQVKWTAFMLPFSSLYSMSLDFVWAAVLSLVCVVDNNAVNATAALCVHQHFTPLFYSWFHTHKKEVDFCWFDIRPWTIQMSTISLCRKRLLVLSYRTGLYCISSALWQNTICWRKANR